jgi:hypothetical protein
VRYKQLSVGKELAKSGEFIYEGNRLVRDPLVGK